jgi:DNA-binding CsgD family transcriptional regulator
VGGGVGRRIGTHTCADCRLRRQDRGDASGPATGWNSLTPTELQVVELVAQGLTNPEIGQRLFIGRGTVKTHLSHVFAKLNVSSRAELAAAVSRRG